MTAGTGNPEAAPAVSETGPNVKAAAEAARERRGSKVKAGIDRARKAGKRIGRPPKREAEAVDAEPAEPPTPEEIQGAAGLGGTVWALAGPMFGFRPLADDEAQRLGAALAPVLKKYLPLLADWQLEINLALVVYGLAQTTKIPKPPKEVETEMPIDG